MLVGRGAEGRVTSQCCAEQCLDVTGTSPPHHLLSRLDPAEEAVGQNSTPLQSWRQPVRVGTTKGRRAEEDSTSMQAL